MNMLCQSEAVSMLMCVCACVCVLFWGLNMKTCDRGRLSKVIKIASCTVGHNLELVDVIRDQKLATLVDAAQSKILPRI